MMKIEYLQKKGDIIMETVFATTEAVKNFVSMGKNLF